MSATLQRTGSLRGEGHTPPGTTNEAGACVPQEQRDQDARSSKGLSPLRAPAGGDRAPARAYGFQPICASPGVHWGQGVPIDGSCSVTKPVPYRPQTWPTHSHAGHRPPFLSQMQPLDSTETLSAWPMCMNPWPAWNSLPQARWASCTQPLPGSTLLGSAGPWTGSRPPPQPRQNPRGLLHSLK